MRLKSVDGPLQVVHNGNNGAINSPKRINTVQNSNYSQNTQDIEVFDNVNTNDTDNISKKIQQLTIEDVAALTNVHNDTQELRWCNSNHTATESQEQLSYQRQLALNNIANNRININSNLAARLRFRAQNASLFEEHQMPQSPDDVLIDDDEAHQSCSSSLSASPQEEDRSFDPSDSADSSDEGNDYSRPTSVDIRAAKLKSFVNPNYPGFQHLAHTLDFDDETLNNANNNNEDYEPVDKFDSVNRLDSVENIQKVFHDKSLDIEVVSQFPNGAEVDRDSPNGSCSTNCDSGSECGGTSDTSSGNDDTGGTVNENFNIRLAESKVFDSVVKSVVSDDSGSKIDGNSDVEIDINKIESVSIDDSASRSDKDVVPRLSSKDESTFIHSVVGNFRKEVEDELGRMCHQDSLAGLNQHEGTETTAGDTEETIESLEALPDLQPYSTACSTETNITEKSSSDMKETMMLEGIKTVKNPYQMCMDEDVESKGKNPSISEETGSQYETQEMDVDNVNPSTLIQTIPKKNHNNNLRERGSVKNIPSFLPLNQVRVNESASILSPIENKMLDASLSSCKENISKIIIEKAKRVEDHVESGSSRPDVNYKMMEVDGATKKIDLGRRDSNRELEEIEIQIKKIKSDTLCRMEEGLKLRIEANENNIREEENTSVLRKNPTKINTYVKKRRDYNQQFGSLITFPKKEPVKRDPLNRRSVPMVKDRRKANHSESLGGFDVYNIETAMPNIDLEAIECHLRAAREEERRRRTDREEIRRRLAMGSEDDYYTDRPGRKPSLQARLQSGMNLQICFMNETVSDSESPTSDNECPLTNPKQLKTKQNANTNQTTGNITAPVQRPATLSLHPTPPPQLSAATAETDFFTKQARLQTEARMALAQAKEMARMQMEIERQKQKKSPITEMVRHSLEKVGIPFPEEKRRLSRQILTEMNVAQLQVIVNDLHTQIESLNEQLVKFLMDRDDLHMEQDSMLVDIEDLTRYLGAKEQVFKEQQLTSTPQNNNLLPPPSPAPSSPLAALNSTVRPHLNRIASLVKK